MSMFKNWKDKIKKGLEDTKLPKLNRNSTITFDESYLVFQVDAGAKHSDPIVASARVRDGSHAGEPIPIQCKWFLSDVTDEMKEIENYTEPVYRPNIDDVGSRVLVQAIPLLDGKYTGSPIFGEAGPIVVDQGIEKQALEKLKEPLNEFPINLQQVSFDFDSAKFTVPGEAVIKIDQENKIFRICSKAKETEDGNTEQHELYSCMMTLQYPTLTLTKTVQNQFEVSLAPEKNVLATTNSPAERDILAVVTRMCEKEKPQNEQENEEEQKNGEEKEQVNIASMIKIEKLIKENKRLTRENEQLENNLEMLRELNKKLEEEVEKYLTRLDGTLGSLDMMSQQMAQANEEKEKAIDEKSYFLSEMKLVKAQNEELEKKLNHFLEMGDIQATIEEEKDKVRQEHDEAMRELRAKLTNQEIENESIKTELDVWKQTFEELEGERDELQGQVNLLMNQIKLIKSENERSRSPSPPKKGSQIASSSFKNNHNTSQDNTESQSESEINLFPDTKFINIDDLNQKDQINQLEEEVKQLKQHNKVLMVTLEGMKTAKTKAPIKGKKNQKNVKGSVDPEYLQKLVNTLTETITERDYALESQKITNKSLAKKISELEEQLKIVNKTKILENENGVSIQ